MSQSSIAFYRSLIGDRTGTAGQLEASWTTRLAETVAPSSDAAVSRSPRAPLIRELIANHADPYAIADAFFPALLESHTETRISDESPTTASWPASGKTILSTAHAARIFDPLPKLTPGATDRRAYVSDRGSTLSPIAPSHVLEVLADPQPQVIEARGNDHWSGLRVAGDQLDKLLRPLGLNLHFEEEVTTKTSSWSQKSEVHFMTRLPSFPLLQSLLITAFGDQAKLCFVNGEEVTLDDWNKMRAEGYNPIRLGAQAFSDIFNPSAPRGTALDTAFLDVEATVRNLTSTPTWMRQATTEFYNVLRSPMSGIFGDFNKERYDRLDLDSTQKKMLDEKRAHLARGDLYLKTNCGNDTMPDSDLLSDIILITNILTLTDGFTINEGGRAASLGIIKDYRRRVFMLMERNPDQDLSNFYAAISRMELQLERGTYDRGENVREQAA